MPPLPSGDTEAMTGLSRTYKRLPYGEQQPPPPHVRNQGRPLPRARSLYEPYSRHGDSTAMGHLLDSRRSSRTRPPSNAGGIISRGGARDPEQQQQQQQQQWLFCPNDLLSTPTIRQGMGAQTEREFRYKGCNFICACARRLRLPQVVASTACVLFHRFFMRKSFTTYHHYDIAGTCLFLATKIEDKRVKLQTMSRVCAETALKKSSSTITSKNISNWNHTITRYEVVILETCCFDLTICHPYAILEEGCTKWSCNAHITKVAWAYVNDCMRHTLCLLYTPATIATAALYCAGCVHDSNFESRSIPLDDWLRTKRVSWHDVAECMLGIIDFYRYEDSYKSQNPKSVDASSMNASGPDIPRQLASSTYSFSPNSPPAFKSPGIAR
ncbi:hypothetical protein EV182_005164 [Spiromyces aspiralis]|uniref:Uncharacterized protein n=1 Tax=Spiromyces aspiralis TaxID=68401 RepID=A0ACC1HBV5_9FUNG|nr:hypothetical protein EV182_005164 [Spiromyces aspiralis]